jgi:hypothetical protein
MNQVQGSKVHWHVTILLDWKMAAVVSIPILIRLLMK